MTYTFHIHAASGNTAEFLIHDNGEYVGQANLTFSSRGIEDWGDWQITDLGGGSFPSETLEKINGAIERESDYLFEQFYENAPEMSGEEWQNVKSKVEKAAGVWYESTYAVEEEIREAINTDGIADGEFIDVVTDDDLTKRWTWCIDLVFGKITGVHHLDILNRKTNESKRITF